MLLPPRLILFGRSTYGKTYLAKLWVERAERFVFVDPKGIEELGRVCSGLEELRDEMRRCYACDEELRVTFYPELDGKEGVAEFSAVCRIVEEMGRGGAPILFCVDEIHHWVNPRGMPNAFSRLLRMAPGINVKLLGLSQRYTDFNPLFFTQAEVIISVKQSDERDLESVERFSDDFKGDAFYELLGNLDVGEYVVLHDDSCAAIRRKHSVTTLDTPADATLPYEVGGNET